MNGETSEMSVEKCSSSSDELRLVLSFLRKHKLSSAESSVLDEFKLSKSAIGSEGAGVGSERGSTTDNVLTSYKSESDSHLYETVYQDLLRFVDTALDMYRAELSLVLYPVFVHMYLELVYNGHESEARHLMQRFGPLQDGVYSEDVKKLSYITKCQHMKGSELMDAFQTSQFTVRMSRDTYSQLRQQKKHMSEKHYSILWNVIQEHLYLDVYEGIPRGRKQIAATSGAMAGEANRQANKAKLFYGLNKDPDLSAFLGISNDDNENNSDTNDNANSELAKSKSKKKLKKEAAMLRKQKNDPNAPPINRIPFPDLLDSDKLEKARQMRESVKRQIITNEAPPSACFYTVLNSGTSVTAVEISDDSSMLIIGFANSHIRVWSLLSSQKLKKLKSSDELVDIDPDLDDVMHRMMDDHSAETSRTLFGHSGAIFGLSLCLDRTLLLSCSEDATIRLWSLQTWTNLVCYRGHLSPVWDVQFCLSHSAKGYYFASCGHDKTARLWTTEQSNCVRLFVGHLSDVDIITFHPNANYVATGSSDRSVRVWDCLTGNCVRLLTGHKNNVVCVKFSNDGRFLVTGGLDKRVLLWDMSHGHLLGDFGLHSGMVTSLAFSRDGNVLVSTSVDFSLIVWDFSKFVSELSSEEVNVMHNPKVCEEAEKYRMSQFYTKDTPVLRAHFTRRNLLLAVGPFM